MNQTKKGKPAPEAAVAAFSAASARLEGAETRQMFGYPCVFANGHMFAGLHEAGLILRLSDPDRRRFVATFNAKLFDPMPGRVMREYALVPKELLGEPDELTSWLRKSLAYVRSLGPKLKGGKAAKTR